MNPVRQPDAPEAIPAYRPPPVALEETVELTTSQDGKDLFRRFFWRAPNESDQILEAERRVWENAEGDLRAWQGYLAIIPSDELDAYLASNPFRLTRVDTPDWPKRLEDAPDWFPGAEELSSYDLQSSRDATFHLIRQKSPQKLYVIGQGSGFR